MISPGLEIYPSLHPCYFGADNIESNIQQTVAHTKQGVVEIRKAAEYQNKARSKLCCVAIIFAVLAAGAVIAVVIYLATRPKT
jgi:t-SNARE complex subunit (syntaxin)